MIGPSTKMGLSRLSIENAHRWGLTPDEYVCYVKSVAIKNRLEQIAADPHYRAAKRQVARDRWHKFWVVLIAYVIGCSILLSSVAWGILSLLFIVPIVMGIFGAINDSEYRTMYHRYSNERRVSSKLLNDMKYKHRDLFRNIERKRWSINNWHRVTAEYRAPDVERRLPEFADKPAEWAILYALCDSPCERLLLDVWYDSGEAEVVDKTIHYQGVAIEPQVTQIAHSIESANADTRPEHSYRIDFLINNQLAVEIDGPDHLFRKDADDKRDEALKHFFAITTLRVTNDQVYHSPQAVATYILDQAKTMKQEQSGERIRLHQPTDVRASELGVSANRL